MTGAPQVSSFPVLAYWNFWFVGWHKKKWKENLPWQRGLLEGPFKALQQWETFEHPAFPASPPIPPCFPTLSTGIMHFFVLHITPFLERNSFILFSRIRPGESSQPGYFLSRSTVEILCFFEAKCHQLAIQHSCWGGKKITVFWNADCIKWQLDWRTVITLGSGD